MNSGTGDWDIVSDTTASDPYSYVLDGVPGCESMDPDNNGIIENDYNGGTVIWPGQVEPGWWVGRYCHEWDRGGRT